MIPAFNLKEIMLQYDERNHRFHKAILKVGAIFEGVLQQDRLRENGTYRSSAYFSMLQHEWPDIKWKLEQQIQQKTKN